MSIDKSEWVTENPKVFEYDSKNKAVDVFVRPDLRCPFPFHKDDWFHQGFFLNDFVSMIKQFFHKNDLGYSLIKVV